MKAGIAATLLIEQVKNTSGWLWADPRAGEVTRALDDVAAAEADRVDPKTGGGRAYLRLLLAAHFATVGTFVPTDVDSRIRHHAWAAIEDAETLAAAVGMLDEVASWDPRWVSARVVDGVERGRMGSRRAERAPFAGVTPFVREGGIADDGGTRPPTLSGHDGEWFSVRAGALGRAAQLGADRVRDALADAIDRELDREAAALATAVREKAPPRRVLSMANTIAHNVGDLSRVVDAWPAHPDLAPLRARFTRLGHEGAPAGADDARRKIFVAAGAVNKAMMAHENHRFLPLRKARGLRRSRDLLLPFGPWFDGWGERVARAPSGEENAAALDHDERAEVVTALLELHLASPQQLGCLRALAGIHRATAGGLESYAGDLPARIRKEILRGRVREALDVTAARFEARMDHRYALEMERLLPLFPRG